MGSTRTETLELAEPPRPSSTLAVMVHEPRGTPAESQRTVGPVPSTLPQVEDHVQVKGSLSGSEAVQLTVTTSPESRYTMLLSSVQETVGGWLTGGAFSGQ